MPLKAIHPTNEAFSAHGIVMGLFGLLPYSTSAGSQGHRLIILLRDASATVQLKAFSKATANRGRFGRVAHQLSEQLRVGLHIRIDATRVPNVRIVENPVGEHNYGTLPYEVIINDMECVTISHIPFGDVGSANAYHEDRCLAMREQEQRDAAQQRREATGRRPGPAERNRNGGSGDLHSPGLGNFSQPPEGVEPEAQGLGIGDHTPTGIRGAVGSSHANANRTTQLQTAEATTTPLQNRLLAANVGEAADITRNRVNPGSTNARPGESRRSTGMSETPSISAQPSCLRSEARVQMVETQAQVLTHTVETRRNNRSRVPSQAETQTVETRSSDPVSSIMTAHHMPSGSNVSLIGIIILIEEMHGGKRSVTLCDIHNMQIQLYLEEGLAMVDGMLGRVVRVVNGVLSRHAGGCAKILVGTDSRLEYDCWDTEAEALRRHWDGSSTEAPIDGEGGYEGGRSFGGNRRNMRRRVDGAVMDFVSFAAA